MAAQNGGRTFFVYIVAKRCLYRFCLSLCGNDAEKMISRKKSRNGKSDRGPWNVVKLSKATVIHLLIAADLIKHYRLDSFGIIEIRHGRIIKGDMSIIGPRPPLPREVEQYDEYYSQRLLVTPGLTCYWQIMPYRNRLSFEEWVDLDIKYIRERSFLTDWKIILATFGAVLGMNGE